ncbi:MAG: hypothetical protein KDE27_18025, partial [Planctomycetes bacterium]|nr:hypothetical protein [Planctomycetota bacterium]
MTGTRAWRRAAVPTFAAACLAAGAAAQGWRDEQIREVGLQFRAPSYLERIPQRLGAEDGFVRARLEPKRKQDFVDDAYKWTVLVVEFEPQPAPEKPVRAKGVAGQLDAPPGPPPSFRAWLGQHKGLKIVTEGEPTRGQRGKLDYRHWVWKWEQYHGEAAVYDFDGREVALAIWMPTPRARGEEPPEKPSVKWSKLINSILKSGSAFEVEADADDDREDRQRDKFADTDERRAALERAKANIAGLEGWDYFTTPNYVVLYSWQSRTNSARNASKNDAKFYSSRLERMRELYAEHYPLDEAGRRAVMPDPKSIPEPKGSAGPITGR